MEQFQLHLIFEEGYLAGGSDRFCVGSTEPRFDGAESN